MTEFGSNAVIAAVLARNRCCWVGMQLTEDGPFSGGSPLFEMDRERPDGTHYG